MTVEAGDWLVRALQDHNPWWADGAQAFSLPAREKSDFYHLARPTEDGSQFEDQPLLALVGRRGVGKTTLLHQFVHHRIANGDPPERFLYLPFDGNPLYQLQSDEQLRRAVRYYERRVFGRVDTDRSPIVLVDDVHQIEHPTKSSVDGWGVPVAELVDDDSERHVVVTASAGVQIDRELAETPVSPTEYDVQPILPEKFRDYVFSVYPDLEDEQTRVSPTSLRTGETGLPRALQEDTVEPFLDELRSKHERVEHAADRIESQVVDYLAMGGIISYDRDGVVESAQALGSADYTRLRENVNEALYQEVPNFESIQTIADLERLCALAARNRAAESFRYQELVDLFDVDRRTITDSYLSALEALYLLTGVTEYDNSRPRSVKLFLRDTGLVTALTDGDASTVHTDFDREADLARLAAFDHTMRLEYGINALQGSESAPSVQYWRGRDGEVDFVFEVDDVPVPVGLAYRPQERDESRSAVGEFTEAYDVPIGLVVVGETVRGEEPVAHLGDGVIRLPYWLYLLLC